MPSGLRGGAKSASGFQLGEVAVVSQALAKAVKSRKSTTPSPASGAISAVSRAGISENSRKVGSCPNRPPPCIENGYPGDDNLDSDPMFLTWPEDGCLFDDYHLDVNSPCIDLGDPCNVVGLFDVDLDQRITGEGVDIGADEVQPEAEGPPEPNYTGDFDLLIYDYSDGQVKRWDPKTGLYEGVQVPRHVGYLMNVTGWTPVGDMCVVVGNYDRIYSWNGASLDLIIQDGTLGALARIQWSLSSTETT